jgi:AraC-like DNA-binding protein
MNLGVALQGTKRVRIGDHDLVYDRLKYFVVRGDVAYAAMVEKASPERPYLSIGLQLPPELIAGMLLDLADVEPSLQGEPEDGPPAFLSVLDDVLIDALTRLVDTLDHPRERRVLAPLILREIVFRLLCSDAASFMRRCVGSGSDRTRIRQAMAFIEANAVKGLTVESIARSVAMSPSHFAHRFRAVASTSPIQYLRHLRLERAREMLLTDGSAASEVASRVGYASPSHFSRDFKRHFGFAPASYARAFVRPTVWVDRVR